MPQLDFSTFAPQIVWLVISFIALYFLMSKLALPRIATVLETRRDRIASDLDEANRLRTETEEVIQAYEAELAEARAKAHSIATEMRETLNADIAEKQAEIDAQIDARMGEAEARISAMKDQAMGEVSAAAVDTADEIIRKLVGGKPAKAAITKAVAAARGN